jgi:hypothetical protein
MDALLGNVVEADAKACERTNMGNAAAHLTGADDANGFDRDTHVPAASGALRLQKKPGGRPARSSVYS